MRGIPLQKSNPGSLFTTVERSSEQSIQFARCARFSSRSNRSNPSRVTRKSFSKGVNSGVQLWGGGWYSPEEMQNAMKSLSFRVLARETVNGPNREFYSPFSFVWASVSATWLSTLTLDPILIRLKLKHLTNEIVRNFNLVDPFKLTKSNPARQM